MNKIAVIIGTRPEAIKCGPVVLALKKDPRFEVIVISTGQHREMLDEALNVFDIIPDYDLSVMSSGQSLSKITSRIINGLDNLLKDVSPDAITVHGDTGTTLAAAIAGFQNQIPIIHIEAGLRSGSNLSPFPEEGNRKLVAQIASLHLAPTKGNAENLLKEGVSSDNIVITGNTIVDALKWAISQKRVSPHPIFDTLEHENRKVILASAHHRDACEKISEIAQTMKIIADRNDVRIIIPMHKNPVIRKVLLDHLSGLENIDLIEPLNYLDFCHLMNRVDLILSDSSGAEEEGPTLGKPTLILRTITERPEAVKTGSALLIGNSSKDIIKNVNYFLDNINEIKNKEFATDQYGDGYATNRVINAIFNFLSKKLNPLPSLS